MAQCGEANQNEYTKLQLFPLSLSGAAFFWYSSLAPILVKDWADGPNLRCLLLSS